MTSHKKKKVFKKDILEDDYLVNNGIKADC